jgi:hypothetical protein
MVSRLPPDFETNTEARKRRKHRVRLLRRGGSRSKALARKLAWCTKAKRCDSDACSSCKRRFRLRLYREAAAIIKTRPDWTRASVVTTGLLVGYKKLVSVDLSKVVKLIRKRLERSSLRGRMIIGGVDISLNLQDNVILGWQLPSTC